MNQLNTEILSVGTELLLGHITNTDARDISEMLSRIGINVKYHTVVGDNSERLRDCVRIAKQRADILITTGGLGPTCDDLTGSAWFRMRPNCGAFTITSITVPATRQTISLRPCCRKAVRFFITSGGRRRAAHSAPRAKSS